MKKLFLPLVFSFFCLSSYASDNFSQLPDAASHAISALQSTVLRDGIPYSPEYLDFVKHVDVSSITSSPTALTIVGTAIIAGIGSFMAWRPVAAGAVSAGQGIAEVGKVAVDQYKKKVDSDLETNKKLLAPRKKADDALEIMNHLSVTQIQMLALTEATNNDQSHYFRNKYAEIIRVKQNAIDLSQNSPFPRIQVNVDNALKSPRSI